MNFLYPSIMKFKLTRTELIKNKTILHLESWLIAVKELIAEENVFESFDELAKQLIAWKNNFLKANPTLDKDINSNVQIRLFARDAILISSPETGEFLLITQKSLYEKHLKSIKKLQHGESRTTNK